MDSKGQGKREVISGVQIFGNGGNVSRGISGGFHKNVPWRCWALEKQKEYRNTGRKKQNKTKIRKIAVQFFFYFLSIYFWK